ncbi:MaoC family dehydratase N-terminal domain-containing protein [Roseococcus sp. DSY-14]|uniref:FAS1-like dehydratase domain-containing protein n=1 Tax=Roseococcus sp. DSY-14 TaxID=3369650 RepID=UPI00387B5BF7
MAFEEFIGKTETAEDRLDPRLVQGLAATLDLEVPQGDVPPLWHWMLFQDWRRPSGVGPDGHPRRGGFLPPVHDLPRRMWAGGRLEFTANALRAEDRVTRRSTILAVREKTGGSGRLVFVTVQHALANDRGPVLTEEHDIVYRGAEGAAVKPAAAAADFGPALERVEHPDALMLFRYSALTGNGHRIHYDLPYVTQEEGYPGLVVHGPLQGTFMAAAVLAAAPGRRLARFAFRGARPAFAGHPLRVLARVEGDAARAETRDPSGATCMAAEATLA